MLEVHDEGVFGVVVDSELPQQSVGDVVDSHHGLEVLAGTNVLEVELHSPESVDLGGD